MIGAAANVAYDLYHGLALETMFLVVLIILSVATFAAFYAIGWILSGFFKGS